MDKVRNASVSKLLPNIKLLPNKEPAPSLVMQKAVLAPVQVKMKMKEQSSPCANNPNVYGCVNRAANKDDGWVR